MWKNAIALIIFTFLNCLSGLCQSVVSPDASLKVIGVYQILRISVFTDGISIQEVDMSNPKIAARASTIITAQRKTATTVTLRLHQYQDTTVIMSYLYGDVVLQASATGHNLFLRNNKIGSIDGNRLNIDMESTDKQTGIVKRSLLEGRKKEE